MERVYIIGGLRSHIGVRHGIFRHILPEQLGAGVVQAVLRRWVVPRIDGLYCGNAVGTGGNIGRLMALEAGLPVAVPAVTVDLQCASSLAAIDMAFNKLAVGQARYLLAGGIESTSLQPERRYHVDDPRSSLRERAYTCAQFIPSDWGDDAMLMGAEKAAAQAGITRAEADAAAFESQKKAREAQQKGLLQACIVPLFGSTRDEAIRPRLSAKVLQRAPLISRFPQGILTAANTCTINDGAAFLLLATEEEIRQKGCPVAAEIVASQWYGGDPERPPLGADLAAAKLIQRAGLTYDDINAFEYNEAFSIIDVLFAKAHPEAWPRFNRFGGALAYGHPYGASGAIIVLHLLQALEAVQGTYGIASIAAAGGVALSLLIRRCSP